MVLYQGVVAQGDNGKFLSRSGHWGELKDAALFDQRRLSNAIERMQAPGPFSGQLKLIPAQREEQQTAEILSPNPLSTLSFPPQPHAGSKLTYDPGATVASLLVAVEPPASDPSKRKPTCF
jgi:hypothetical protein